VHGKVVIGRVDIRIVTVGFAHTHLGIVGNCQRRNATPMIEGVDVRSQLRFHLLVSRGFSPGVGTGAEGDGEERSLPRHTGDAITNWNRRAGPVDEGVLACLVPLPHHHVEFLAPALIQLAEPTVTIAVGVGLAVLLPKQLHRNVVVTAELLMDHGKARR